MLEPFFTLAGQILQLHPLLIALFLVALIVIAYKVFRFAMKAVFTGLCFAFFPLVANMIGLSMPITLQSLLSFASLGIVVFFVFHTVTSGYKIIRIILSPFSVPKKQVVKTVIVKEKKKEGKK